VTLSLVATSAPAEVNANASYEPAVSTELFESNNASDVSEAPLEISLEGDEVSEEAFTVNEEVEQAERSAPADAEVAPAEAEQPFCPLWPKPPFPAWVTAAAANIRASPDKHAHIVGLVHGGDMLQVVSCSPDCVTAGAWALLGNAGAIRLNVLQPIAVPNRFHSAQTHYFYGKVKDPGLHVYAKPDVHSHAMSKQLAGHVLAFVDVESNAANGDAAPPKGWLRHVSGGYVQRSQVVLTRASHFEGVHDPTGPLAFLKKATVVQPSHRKDKPQKLARQAHVSALGLLPGGRVQVEGGSLPRDAVALAFPRARPAGVGPNDKWVHVDTGEQVLTAYEGDRWVFATMISSGKRKSPTKPGTFRVWAKISHSTMKGGGRHPYEVEEVPHVLSFNHEQALHAAFWHDHFGTAGSHGCVNLSPTDASWLFDWAPPTLPQGWHTVVTKFANLGTLTVVVERARLGSFHPDATAPAPAAPAIAVAPAPAAVAGSATHANSVPDAGVAAVAANVSSSPTAPSESNNQNNSELNICLASSTGGDSPPDVEPQAQTDADPISEDDSIPSATFANQPLP
jgi:hypothetical protein